MPPGSPEQTPRGPNRPRSAQSPGSWPSGDLLPNITPGRTKGLGVTGARGTSPAMMSRPDLPTMSEVTDGIIPRRLEAPHRGAGPRGRVRRSRPCDIWSGHATVGSLRAGRSSGERARARPAGRFTRRRPRQSFSRHIAQLPGGSGSTAPFRPPAFEMWSLCPVAREQEGVGWSL
jgi:hypothetical protein